MATKSQVEVMPDDLFVEVDAGSIRCGHLDSNDK